MDALDLLHTYAPILRFNARENYLPMRVEPYLARCSLWRAYASGRNRLLKTPPVTNADLARARVTRQSVLYLQFAQPNNLPPVTRDRYWEDEPQRASFQSAIDALGKVVVLGQVFSGLFDFIWALFGELPRGTVASAYQQYRAMSAAERAPTYYGRVVARGDYTVLQYWFFYALNDWRSNALGYGVNDHEGDWEHVDVILKNDVPEFVAASAHNFRGVDLRRAWSDVIKRGTHPVICAGCGSHANYFEATTRPIGEFEIGTNPNSFAARLGRWLRPRRAPRLPSGAVGFADVAQGDGIAVGPADESAWRADFAETQVWSEPVVLDETGGVNVWGAARDFRGLWGRYVRDVTGRENGPAGPPFSYARLLPRPRLNPRKDAWDEPLRWAGIDI
jgi:hypothetical protein